MSIFRRKREPSRTQPYDSAPGYVRMHEDDLAEDMNDFVVRLGEAYNSEPLSDDQENNLSMAVPFMLQRKALPETTGSFAYSVARFGFFKRAIEYERLDYARGVVVAMYASAFSTQAGYREGQSAEDDAHNVQLALLSVATGLAHDEPLKSQPEDWKGDQGPLTWGIPGLGGELRAQLADHTIVDVCNSFGLEKLNELEGLSYEELRQGWNAGFFLRYLYELFDPNLLGEQAAEALHRRMREASG